MASANDSVTMTAEPKKTVLCGRDVETKKRMSERIVLLARKNQVIGLIWRQPRCCVCSSPFNILFRRTITKATNSASASTR